MKYVLVMYTKCSRARVCVCVCVSGQCELAAGCRTEMVLQSLHSFSVPSAGFVYVSLFIIKLPALDVLSTMSSCFL